MGWVAEGFDPIAGSEIDPWCVDHASRLFPQMKQLGDLKSLTADNMVSSDVLIVGTTCTAVSISKHPRHAKRTGRHQDGAYAYCKVGSQSRLQSYGV